MGLNIDGTRFLLHARARGVNFERTAMIGRQALHLQHPELRRCFEAFGRPIDAATAESIFTRTQGFAEQLLTELGANEVHSFDYSPFEGATHVHSMNVPVPEQFKERYTVVLDGGSLEHVFNFPTAIKNCMEMLEVGGHYLAITPANNFVGHGFYQFSPELFFSVFTLENGFELTRMIAYEDVAGAPWYTVRSPREVADRVTLINSEPVYLLIIAKKIGKAEIFATQPLQSDYVAVWDKTAASGKQLPAAIKGESLLVSVIKLLPPSVRRMLRMLRRCFVPAFDRRFYAPIVPERGE